jgi:hypothetical protein
MNRLDWLNTLHILGETIDLISEKEYAGDTINPVLQDCLSDLKLCIDTEHRYNGWFTPDSILSALNGIRSWLYRETLTSWLESYPITSSSRKVLIIMAGNLPLVGFHDVLCVLVSGKKALIKLSSKDQHLLPALWKIILHIEPRASEYVEFTMGKVTNFDAVIATGSNNSLLYFQQYFGHVPHIFRKNRTGLAVLDGTETEVQLFELGKDIFTYFGLGCRNITQLLLPNDFDINRFFAAIVPYGDIINHNKYANNYDYHRALFLLNQEDFLDNNFLIIKENNSIFSPVAVLHVTRYAQWTEVERYINLHEADIQLVVGNKFLPFGNAQLPGLSDYADGVDTLEFLLNT